MFIYKFILVVCAIVFVFGALYGLQIDFSAFSKKFGRKKSKKEMTLKDKVDILTNSVKPNFFKRQFIETSAFLEQTGQGEKYKRVKIMSVLLALVGAAVGFVFQNLWLVPVLVCVFACIPFVYVKSLSSKYRRRVGEDLETGLSLITTSYLRNENIVEAVKENLNDLPKSIRGVFEEFCFENEFITPNLNTALNNMKFKINNPIFHEWINALIQCSNNKDVKQILEPIIEKFSVLRTVQSDLDVAIGQAKMEAILMSGITIGIIPLLKVFNKDWYQILIGTTQGKISMIIAFLVVAVCLYKIVVLSRPLEYYETETDDE